LDSELQELEHVIQSSWQEEYGLSFYFMSKRFCAVAALNGNINSSLTVFSFLFAFYDLQRERAVEAI